MVVVFIRSIFIRNDLEGIFFWLLQMVLVLVGFYLSQLVFAFINTLLLTKIRQEIRKRQFGRLREVRIYPAQIVRCDWEQVTYLIGENGYREKFVVGFKTKPEPRDRLWMIYGKDKKGRDRLFSMLENQELRDTLLAEAVKEKQKSLQDKLQENKIAHEERKLDKKKIYPHPNVNLLKEQEKLLSPEEKALHLKKYQKKWILT